MFLKRKMNNKFNVKFTFASFKTRNEGTNLGSSFFIYDSQKSTIFQHLLQIIQKVN